MDQGTPAERAARGRHARSSVPRSELGHWEAPDDRRDPLSILADQNEARVPELVPIRYGRMVASPFAFYRGAAAVMAADLAPLPRTGLEVQLCGDAHLTNFGGFATPERDLIFDVNDFDETIRGPFEWDVKRLAASLDVAARGRSFADRDRLGAVRSRPGLPVGHAGVRDDARLSASGTRGSTPRSCGPGGGPRPAPS